MSKPTEKRLGSLLVSLFFVAAGFVTLYDTGSYTDVDSQVFPRAVAVILIVTASLACAQWFWDTAQHDQGFGNGIWWRRCLIVTSLLFACFLIPLVGFFWASVVAFCGGLMAAMHDRWTRRTALIYTGVGLFTVAAFYSLFKFALHVPLP
ncbi:MAG: tripartite tricarboxylate transporter TctB family protein [Granulosicoccaceae bacterium]